MVFVNVLVPVVEVIALDVVIPVGYRIVGEAIAVVVFVVVVVAFDAFEWVDDAVENVEERFFVENATVFEKVVGIEDATIFEEVITFGEVVFLEVEVVELVVLTCVVDIDFEKDLLG